MAPEHSIIDTLLKFLNIDLLKLVVKDLFRNTYVCAH